MAHTRHQSEKVIQPKPDRLIGYFAYVTVKTFAVSCEQITWDPDAKLQVTVTRKSASCGYIYGIIPSSDLGFVTLRADSDGTMTMTPHTATAHNYDAIYINCYAYSNSIPLKYIYMQYQVTANLSSTSSSSIPLNYNNY